MKPCAINLASLLLVFLLALAATPTPAPAQELYGPPAASTVRTPLSIDPTRALGDDVNPVSVIGAVGETLTGLAGRGDQRGSGAVRQGEGGDEGGGLSAGINVIVLLTVITLVPSIMLMCTCFVRIVIVLGLLKQALGTQTLPPPQVIVGLALFMTLLVMSPTLDRMHREAILPYRAGEIRNYDELWSKARQPLRDFMFDQIETTGNWSSVYMILNYRGVDTSDPSKLSTADVDMITLVPAFMLSELKTGFLIGFKVFLPFLVIDIVISSLLISMGMMMLPPVLISLPFKLLLFVLVDGWTLVIGSLLQSFVVRPGPGTLAAHVQGASSHAGPLAVLGFG